MGAVAISNPASEEYWKGFVHQGRFEGVVPALWRSVGVTIYNIPRRTESLAHVILEAAVVSRTPTAPEDISGMERYAVALEDPSLPEAESYWDSRATSSS